MRSDVTAFRPPPAILQRVLAFKALQHKEGKVLLWGIPGVLSPVYSNVFLQRLMEKELGIKKTQSIFYILGNFHSRQTFKMISERFGYAQSIPDKKKLMIFQAGQAEMAGLGPWEWIRIDLDNVFFVAKGSSAFAEEYKRFFGVQNNPVDYIMRGHVNAFAETATNKKLFSVETRCIASGQPYCEIVTKPIEKWDKNDPLFKSQLVEDLPSDIKKLGAKIQPYLALK